MHVSGQKGTLTLLLLPRSPGLGMNTKGGWVKERGESLRVPWWGASAFEAGF